MVDKEKKGAVYVYAKSREKQPRYGMDRNKDAMFGNMECLVH